MRSRGGVALALAPRLAAVARALWQQWSPVGMGGEIPMKMRFGMRLPPATLCHLMNGGADAVISGEGCYGLDAELTIDTRCVKAGTH